MLDVTRVLSLPVHSAKNAMTLTQDHSPTKIDCQLRQIDFFGGSFGRALRGQPATGVGSALRPARPTIRSDLRSSGAA